MSSRSGSSTSGSSTSGSSTNRAQAVEVGVVVKPHGVRGQLKVHLHNPRSDALAAQNTSYLWLRTPSGEIVDQVSPQGTSGGHALISIPGVGDCDAAEAFRGAALLLDREAIELEQGQYLYADLIGCRVLQRVVQGDPAERPREAEHQQRDLGEVFDVFEAGASDVLVIRDGKRQRMIPLVDQWVLSVDLDSRIIEVVDGESWEV